MAVISINGIELFYQDQGSGDVVVLLHGLGSTHQDWELQIPVLSQKFRTIAPDFRAHGQSTKIPEKQGVEEMTEDIVQLLNFLNIKNASFVGFSMGGAVAFQLAITHPELAEKLVIVNSGPDFNSAKETGIDLLQERTKIIKEKGFLHLAETISKGMFPENHQEEWREDFKNRVTANNESAYLNTFGQLMNWGLGDQIKLIKQPTLVIGSEMDYTTIDYKKKYTEKLQNAHFVEVKNSRHGIVLDQADALNEELLKFL